MYRNPRMFLDAIHPEDRPRVLAQIEPQLAGEFLDHYDHEFRIVRPDGEVRWIQSRYSPIRDEQGRVVRVAGISDDITERKLSEEARLRHAREQRDTLVREVHHRIKNNLQGVVGLLRLHAGKHPQTAPPLEMAIARIQSMALVFGLRSHVSTERVLLCRMTEAICRSVADLTGAAIEPRVELRGPCPVPVAEGEAVPVALILNELVFNAVKHQVGDSGGRPIVVDIHYLDEHATVTIVTPAAVLPHGFDFAAGRGLGSGLQLVRSLLPRPAADLVMRDSDSGVVAQLTLLPPVIMVRAEAVALLAEGQHTAGVND
jgi:two-component sensor histidine kinase